MKIRFSRAVTAIGLGISLWISSVAALAAPQQPKDQPQSQTQPAATKTDQKAQTTDPKTAPQQAASNKTLSTNEDPTMIGKRNINKGLWGKIAAGTEKEVREGRMLARPERVLMVRSVCRCRLRSTSTNAVPGPVFPGTPGDRGTPAG